VIEAVVQALTPAADETRASPRVAK
jgi:hypothetical protein